MDIRLLGMMNNLSGLSNMRQISNSGTFWGIGNCFAVGSSFSGILREQRINAVKEDIYKKFQISVGAPKEEFQCNIPSDVLYQMSTDSALKKKVYSALEDYSGQEFRKTMETLNPPVKKCTLTFDEEGDVTATLEADVDKETENTSTYRKLYQSALLNQAAGLAYQPGLFSNTGSMYGFGSLQNPLFTSMLGLLYQKNKV